MTLSPTDGMTQASTTPVPGELYARFASTFSPQEVDNNIDMPCQLLLVHYTLQHIGSYGTDLPQFNSKRPISGKPGYARHPETLNVPIFLAFCEDGAAPVIPGLDMLLKTSLHSDADYDKAITDWAGSIAAVARAYNKIPVVDGGKTISNTSLAELTDPVKVPAIFVPGAVASFANSAALMSAIGGVEYSPKVLMGTGMTDLIKHLQRHANSAGEESSKYSRFSAFLEMARDRDMELVSASIEKLNSINSNLYNAMGMFAGHGSIPRPDITASGLTACFKDLVPPFYEFANVHLFQMASMYSGNTIRRWTTLYFLKDVNKDLTKLVEMSINAVSSGRTTQYTAVHSATGLTGILESKAVRALGSHKGDGWAEGEKFKMIRLAGSFISACYRVYGEILEAYTTGGGRGTISVADALNGIAMWVVFENGNIISVIPVTAAVDIEAQEQGLLRMNEGEVVPPMEGGRSGWTRPPEDLGTVADTLSFLASMLGTPAERASMRSGRELDSSDAFPAMPAEAPAQEGTGGLPPPTFLQ